MPSFLRTVYLSVQYEWRLILVAIQFLTRIPVHLEHYQSQWLHESSRHFPAVGLLVGLLCAGVFALAAMLFGSLIAAVVSTAFGIRLTGAFHEDGLADTCDGLGGGLTREQALTIMKDSRLGTYGTLGLICAVLLKVSLLASMPMITAVIALIFGHTGSRLLCTSLIVMLPYGGDIEHAKAKPMAQRMTTTQWLTSGLWLVVAVGLLWASPVMAFAHIRPSQWFCAGVLGLLAVLYMYRLLKKRLNGYTGDGLGATQQLVEVAIYTGLAIDVFA